MAISLQTNNCLIISLRFKANESVYLKMLSTSERVELVLLMHELKSVTLVQRRLKQEGKSHVPSDKTINSLYQKFISTGTVLDAERSGRPSTSAENVAAVDSAFKSEPSLSLRRASTQLGIPRSTVHDVLRKKLHMRPYHIQLVQELYADDFAARLAFCEEFKELIEQNDSFLNSICFSDEAKFSLHGRVIRHNCVVWGTENPHEISPEPLHSPKIDVWFGMFHDRLIGPQFFPDNVRSDSYLEMLQEFLLPQLRQLRRVRSTIFQQDGAAPHWALCVRKFLNATFPNRWIGRAGPILWPPRSPDLTPLDFYLWGFLKDAVYKKKPEDVEQLKQYIREEASNITKETLSHVFADFKTRLDLCIQVNGEQFEHLR